MTSTLPLGGSSSGSVSIPDLVRLAAQGVIRLPRFQRSFVWNSKDVRDLFDSVYRGFPIGTLLLWRQDAPAGEVSFGPITVSSPATSALWVVDGQQRITSLFGSLWPAARNVDDRFEVYFDLATSRFTNPRRGVVAPRAIPVREVLETRSLLTWLRQHENDLELPDFDLAEKLFGVIRDYWIPTYTVTGGDQKLLREVFDRVNSAGHPIRRAQVFHALFASETEPGSPSSVVEELRGLEFGRLDDNRVVQSLLAIRGGNVQRDVHEEFLADEDPADWYDKTESALAAAIGFLRSEGVVHLALMPNTLPLPVLAAFFHLHPEPGPWVLRLLSRWLWRGWVRGFGREGGQTPTLRRAIGSVNPEKLRPERAPSSFDAVRRLLESTPDDPVPRLPMDGFRTDKASSRLILLALASLKPLDLEGKAVDLVHGFEASEVDMVTDLVPGHRAEAAARGFWPRGARRPTGREGERILLSHGIDDVGASMLRDSEIAGFLQARRQYLAESVYGFLGGRLEHGALVRPPLGELVVAEDDFAEDVR